MSMPDAASDMNRRDVVAAALAAAVAVVGSSPANADMLKAACTYADCPGAPKGAAYELELLEVKPSKFTGKGYSYSRPNDTYFKRVTSPSSLRNPGSILFRDKNDADIAIFSDVQEINNKDGSFSPTLVDSYTKNFGEKFKLIAQTGPAKQAGYDLWTYEYVVETELGGKYQKLHFISAFAASQTNIYVVNAQAKEESWAAVGPALTTCVKSLKAQE
eukprot:CAMPEP_0181320418 /NCGR_PEP_ID=MMETSP1101-20121128/18115_1 /TAXON_ID=46948 /ORGANISM="Rhodomonas abbreviata, Strain Caron Lab Isolate" /LENGTH=216 /DNA_ID=CAMNT_0023428125 /DNA_START=163 /DNA_END=813 /DNA_ORIENTATION=+